MIGLEVQFFKSDEGAWERLGERMHVVDEAEEVEAMAKWMKGNPLPITR